jgi:cell division protein FtsW
MITKTEITCFHHLIEVIVILLMAVGTVFVFSAAASIDIEYGSQYFYNFANLKQFLFFPLAVGIIFVVADIDYRRFSFANTASIKSPTLYLFLLSIILLVLVLFIGVTINGARRWLILTIGPISISFQPSELAKWTTIFFLVAFIDKFPDRIRIYWKGFFPICLVAAVIVGLIIIEDFGTAALISLVIFLILVIGGVSWRHLLTPLPLMVAAFSWAIIFSPYRLKRLIDFIKGIVPYQVRQSLMAIGSGGIFGKGLGKGICKYDYLPQDTTDFVFSIIAEELGFFGAAVLIALFVCFIVLGILVVTRCKDQFGCLLASAIVMTIGIQAAVNIGVATNTLPTTGIPLPFVSAGGTSMLLSAAAVGVLVNIAKQTGGTQRLHSVG